MESLTIDYLSSTFERAKELNYQFAGILTEIEGLKKPEITINHVENFESMVAYYKRTYNNNLYHKYKEGKRIIGVTFGNSFSEIEEYLIKNKNK